MPAHLKAVATPRTVPSAHSLITSSVAVYSLGEIFFSECGEGSSLISLTRKPPILLSSPAPEVACVFNVIAVVYLSRVHSNETSALPAQTQLTLVGQRES